MKKFEMIFIAVSLQGVSALCEAQQPACKNKNLSPEQEQKFYGQNES